MNDLLENLYQEDVFDIPRPPAIVVLPESWGKLNEGDVALLSKILGAIKLSLAAVKIITMPVLDIENVAHTEVCNSDVLLLFGSTLKPPVDSYKNVTVKNFKVVQADTLAALDDVKKRSLWLALKELFSKQA